MCSYQSCHFFTTLSAKIPSDGTGHIFAQNRVYFYVWLLSIRSRKQTVQNSEQTFWQSKTEHWGGRRKRRQNNRADGGRHDVGHFPQGFSLQPVNIHIHIFKIFLGEMRSCLVLWRRGRPDRSLWCRIWRASQVPCPLPPSGLRPAKLQVSGNKMAPHREGR